ncbi:hypothetical protein IMG5_190520 [Ichthyophthirius multifiliis]|uniref:HECT-type E3 ubiquitin transferase n=1 Tax=Ichthyophthirius multifiliis TaxID=5932 RepID=G0R485_ICHMU|nr:hypothetical protein IMG5_190520 [Ichthyophthirius multifiliis]EGR27696.1 hypothetical protein IMG5_190520 [Ichthyophthirius multifiliis]|eukprot:XP_004025148.1 hypothetical protein IMG5_190520 [Ichthyophthirius multifiliis]
MVKQNLIKKRRKLKSNRKTLQRDPFQIIFQQLPFIIEFENKKNYFKYQIQNIRQQCKSQYKKIAITVRRNQIFEDSFNQINNLKQEQLKCKFVIEFQDEEGVDAGGLLREWFLQLSKAMLNPDYLLFKPSNTGNTYQPNQNSYFNENHLDYFKFIGRIVGKVIIIQKKNQYNQYKFLFFLKKALFEGQMLEAYFTRSFYKHILGQPLTYHDIQDQDYDFYKSLKWLIETDITNFTDLAFRFFFFFFFKKYIYIFNSFEENQFGKYEQIELIPNGKNITVTEENKYQYVKLICYAKMAKNIKVQIEKFLEGFHELIPHDLIEIFNSQELELIISGLPEIDIQDLKENTEYQNYTKNSKVIAWFWEVLENYDEAQKASFLQFVTGLYQYNFLFFLNIRIFFNIGTSKVPLEGFKQLRGISGLQKFQIHKSYDISKLPTAHTWQKTNIIYFLLLFIYYYLQKQQLQLT